MLFSLATAGPHSTIRQDFIYGVQGATRLTEDDLKLVQTLYTLTTAGKTPTIANVCDVDENLKVPCFLFTFIQSFSLMNPTNQDESFQTASSHFQKLMEGNPAQVGSTRWTYMYAKNLLNRIVRGGYFLRLREEQARTASAAAAIASAAKALTQDSLQLNQTTVLQPATYGVRLETNALVGNPLKRFFCRI